MKKKDEAASAKSEEKGYGRFIILIRLKFLIFNF